MDAFTCELTVEVIWIRFVFIHYVGAAFTLELIVGF